MKPIPAHLYNVVFMLENNYASENKFPRNEANQNKD